MADLSEQEQPPQEIVVPQRPPGFERRARRCLGRPFWLRDFDIPAMRDAPRTRRSNRRRFHLPFRFSEWIRSDAVSMNPPDEFVDVYWEPRCRNSKFKLIETGEIFHITADVDERGRCVFAGGFPDFVYGIGFEGEVRLDFSYMGKGVFEVRIGGDSEEGFGENRFLHWGWAWRCVQRSHG